MVEDPCHAHGKQEEYDTLSKDVSGSAAIVNKHCVNQVELFGRTAQICYIFLLSFASMYSKMPPADLMISQFGGPKLTIPFDQIFISILLCLFGHSEMGYANHRWQFVVLEAEGVITCI